jgi:hypothetical protein
MEHNNDSEFESREHAPQNVLAPCNTIINADVGVSSSTNSRSSNPPQSSNLNVDSPFISIHQVNRHNSNTEVTTSTSDAVRRNNNATPPSLNRISPYDTIMNDSVAIDDETIDAAVVEEIIDDGNNVVPVLLSPEGGPLSASIDCERDNNNTTALQTATNNINVSTEAQLIPHAVSNHMVIPEVEPEVDIEEIHVINDRNVSTISALTNTSISVLDHQDTKEPPSAPRVAAATAPSNDFVGEWMERPQHHDQHLSYSPFVTSGFAAMPPPVPQRAFTSDYRGYSAGTTTSIPPAVPIFKSMVMHPRQSSNDHTINTMAQHPSQEQELPDYKDQARPKMPASVPMNARNVSNNSSGTDNTPNNTQNSSGSNHYSNGGQHSIQHQSDDEHIPVVSAILVPAERLAAEERLEEQWLQQQHRYSHQTRMPGQSGTNSQGSNSNVSSGESTLTTSHTSSNNNNQHLTSQNNEIRNEASTQHTKSADQSNNNIAPPPMSERRFWMTIILTALILNSLLVAGAVVGGFCAAGKCTSGSTSDLENVQPSIPEMNSTTNVPSQSPSNRMLSIVPTVENSASRIDTFPTPVATKIGTSNQPVFESFVISQSPSNLNSNAPALTGAAIVQTITPTFTSSGNDTISDFAPNTDQSTSAPESNDTIAIGTETTVDNTTIVALSPTLSPTPVASNISGGIPKIPATESSNTGIVKNDGKDISLSLLVPLVVGIEAMIIVGLVCYYRRWKRQRS